MNIPAEGCYRVQIIEKDILTKPIRLWSKNLNLKYENPVYENVTSDAKILKDNFIYSLGAPNEPDMEQCLKDWIKEKPTLSDPYYYYACHFLKNRKLKEFLNMAQHYLFLEEKGSSRLFCLYTMAQVFLYQDKIKEAIEHLLPCLKEYPHMAEFWCLLGDIYFRVKEFGKAKSFYENAMLGGLVRGLDELPVEISKYKEYPEKMIKNCETFLGGSEYFAVLK